ncbi:hypothetical protein [Novosphingobium sp. BL-52-GroH]|uniref:hypothetical protein n=1 Tax=Novosphingobium sp. BL-52-GroH TaxID=3349877 RepID=UPI00384C863F
MPLRFIHTADWQLSKPRSNELNTGRGKELMEAAERPPIETAMALRMTMESGFDRRLEVRARSSDQLGQGNSDRMLQAGGCQHPAPKGGEQHRESNHSQQHY